ncbi:ribosome assembly RNA-binding protein YhbY [Desulfospira joergensenii]|uniref:ribosome assembly RNA-binding protein YhbY n=1 Tax=Desulfospira joergensenii TaxID=53329 RepID=UPI0003B4AE91|nr:ribosome assembly RNA-binding protein YhbY [Desulfospira joergensenii]
MIQLKGSQRKYLRGLAHKLNPSALVGQKGVTRALIEEIGQALDAAELIKIKFVDHKDKETKTALTEEICEQTGSTAAGMVGHVVVLFRRNPDPEKQKINLPG